MYTEDTTAAGPLADPINIRLTAGMLAELQAFARGYGCTVSEVIRYRLGAYGDFHREFQGLRAELALQGASVPEAAPDDPLTDEIQRLTGMMAEMLGAMRRYRPVDTQNARTDVERLALPVWERRIVER